MGANCCLNIVLGARRPNGTALLVGSVDRAQTCIWLGACLCEPPVAKWDRSFGRLLYLASNVNLALRSSMRATSFLSLALGWRGLLRATWVGGGPFPTFCSSAWRVSSRLWEPRLSCHLHLVGADFCEPRGWAGPVSNFFPRRGEFPSVYGSHAFLVTCAWLAQAFLVAAFPIREASAFKIGLRFLFFSSQTKTT